MKRATGAQELSAEIWGRTPLPPSGVCSCLAPNPSASRLPTGVAWGRVLTRSAPAWRKWPLKSAVLDLSSCLPSSCLTGGLISERTTPLRITMELKQALSASCVNFLTLPSKTKAHAGQMRILCARDPRLLQQQQLGRNTPAPVKPAALTEPAG